MDNDEVETHDPMTDAESTDEAQDSLDTANVAEGRNDELASYEDEVALLLRGEEPEGDDEAVDEESEGVNGEEAKSDQKSDLEQSSGESQDEEPADDLPSRFRVRTDDPVEKFAMDLRKRNPDLSLKECLERADEHYNPNSSDGDPDVAVSRVEELEAKIDELADQHNKHLAEFETEEAGEVNRQIVELNKELRKAEREEITIMLTETISNNNAKQHYDDALNSSADEATQMFPDLDDTSSSLHKAAMMFDTARASEDPDYANSPERPLIAAMEAAKLLGISANQQQQQSQPKSQRPVIPAARGNAKTQRPQQATNRIDEALDNISSTDEYEALIEKLNA